MPKPIPPPSRTAHPDADDRNADWPKRTPDTFDDLGIPDPRDAAAWEAFKAARKKR